MQGDITEGLLHLDWGPEEFPVIARLPVRADRRMPSLWTIVQYWSRRTPAEFDFEPLAWPHCFACFREVPCREEDSGRDRWNGASPYLDRAHLVNHALNGLDGPQNLVPLCLDCHRSMPIFRGYDEYPGPAEWVRRGGWLFELLCWPASGPPGRALESVCRARQLGDPLCPAPCTELDYAASLARSRRSLP